MSIRELQEVRKKSASAAPADVGARRRDREEPVVRAPVIDAQTQEILSRRRASGHRRGWLVRRALVCADVLGLALAFTLSEEAYVGSPGAPNSFSVGTEYLLFAAVLPLWVLAAKLYGLYDRDDAHADHSTTDDVVRVFHLVTVVVWLLVAVAYVTGSAHPSFEKVVIFWVLAIPSITLLRVAARALCRRRTLYLQNTVIVGAGDVGQLIASKVLRHPEYGINLVGFVDDRPKEPRPGLENLTILGSPDDLGEIAEQLGIERVIVAFMDDSSDHAVELVRSLQRPDIQVDVVPRFFDLVGPSCEIHTLEGLPLVGIPSLRLSRSSRLIKRAVDIALAVAALVLLSPVFLAIAVAIEIETRGPVLFRQRRMGVGDTPFRIFKFRTMTVDAEDRKDEVRHLNKHLAPGSDPRMFKIPDDPRITKVGGFLRRYSLDELPQLLNVVEGSMSLVGPRPLIPEESQYVDNWARRRTDLKPGITGLWQVLGRSDIPFEEMVKLDYLYVTTWSVWRDVLLMFRTIPVALSSRGGSY
jgi:exopolysaccharide biosynthesis polyprenyl glycosylphosphotransferase